MQTNGRVDILNYNPYDRFSLHDKRLLVIEMHLLEIGVIILYPMYFSVKKISALFKMG